MTTTHDAITKTGLGSGLLAGISWMLSAVNPEIVFGTITMGCTAVSAVILVVQRHRRTTKIETVQADAIELERIVPAMNRLMDELSAATQKNIDLNRRVLELSSLLYPTARVEAPRNAEKQTPEAVREQGGDAG